MLADMRAQSDLYRPSSFWTEASDRIVDELSSQGVETFRQLPTPLGFFVPTYGTPGNRLTDELCGSLRAHLAQLHPNAPIAALGLQHLLSGEAAALADYRVVLAGDQTDRLPYLHNFSESRVGAPKEQFEFDGRRFSRSSLNYLLGLVFLKRHLGSERPRSVMEIGGGFGTLGEILAGTGVGDVRYIDVDIPPTSFVAASYLSSVLGRDAVATYTETRGMNPIRVSSLPTATVLNAWQIEHLEGNIDLFVNFISFQEMEPPIVQNYLRHVDRLGARWILLRNLREGHRKRPADGRAGVENPIRGDDYIAMLPGFHLVERQVHPFGFRTVDGFNSELMLFRRNA
jgi:putative sugar O-methyltransferase